MSTHYTIKHEITLDSHGAEVAHYEHTQKEVDSLNALLDTKYDTVEDMQIAVEAVRCDLESECELIIVEDSFACDHERVDATGCTIIVFAQCWVDGIECGLVDCGKFRA